MRVDLRLLRLACFGRADFLELDHSIKDGVTLDRRAFRVLERRETIRTSNQSGEQRGLGQIQLRCVLTEIRLGRCFDAVATGPEINTIDIQLEYLLFAEF